MTHIKFLPNGYRTNTNMCLKCTPAELINHPFVDTDDNPAFFMMLAKELGFDYTNDVKSVYPNNITISGALMDRWISSFHSLNFQLHFNKRFLENGVRIDPSLDLDTVILRENAFIFNRAAITSASN